MLEHRKLDFIFHRIDAVHEHANSLSQTVSHAGVLSDDLARILVVRVVVIGKCVERDQTFDEQVG